MPGWSTRAGPAARTASAADEARHDPRLIDAIHGGAFVHSPTRPDPFFGFGVVTHCPGVPKEIMWPRDAWADGSDYDSAASRLAGLFRDNFRSYEADAGRELTIAGPAMGITT